MTSIKVIHINFLIKYIIFSPLNFHSQFHINKKVIKIKKNQRVPFHNIKKQLYKYKIFIHLKTFEWSQQNIKKQNSWQKLILITLFTNKFPIHLINLFKIFYKKQLHILNYHIWTTHLSSIQFNYKYKIGI